MADLEVADLADMKEFDLTGAELTVWVFKKSSRDGQPVFTGRWVQTTVGLATALTSAVVAAREAITETIEYSILAQNNETSALTLCVDETYMALVDAAAADPTEKRKIKNLKQINNSQFYALRFASDAGVLTAVRKANETWKTKSSSVVRAVFLDEQLDIDERPSFSLEPYFDFFTFGGSVFVSNKKRFESVLSYRLAHAEAFEELTVQHDFAAIFSDVGPIKEFVGSNKMHLRRAIAIREKGHFQDQAFMQRLREQCGAMNLTIQFDAHGRIVPTVESCRHIFQALLDHRLDSRLSNQLYDVQNTEPVPGN